MFDDRERELLTDEALRLDDQAGWDEAFGRPDESELARLTARAIRAANKQEDGR
jgi:hypothetical protein